MTNTRPVFLLSFACLLTASAFAQTITGGTCSVASLSGPYSLSLSGRGISAAGSFSGSLQADGVATFDGQGNVTMTGTVNTNLAAGKSFAYTGTYTIQSNCLGTLTLTSGSTATFTLVVWSSGGQFNITGSDSTYVYSGSGGNPRPACATPTLSGEYTYTATGFLLSGTAQSGSADEAGVFQFDGLGNVTASYTVTSAGTTPAQITSTGTYSVTPGCTASATLTDSTGKGNNVNFVIAGAYGQNLDIIEANSTFVRSGSAHSAFLNPSQSIGNVASYAVGATPPGSIFVLYGTDLATKTASAPTTGNLPTTLLTTTVKVNGVSAPLFYVITGALDQIDAQMPLEIPGGTVASVVVTNGSASSNAAAVYVPATATPGISFYSTNRAVVVDATQNGILNSATAPAAVGDVMVAYFTGGGPVTVATGKLVTGAPSPNEQLPVTEPYSITVGGVPVTTINYVGLSPGSIGLYQANFVVPPIAKGTYPLVITIGGQANTVGAGVPQPLMTISN